MAQARVTLCIINIFLGLLLGPPAEAQLAQGCTISSPAPGPSGITPPPITNCNYATMYPAGGGNFAGSGNFIYQTPQIPDDAVIVNLSVPGIVDYPPIGETCYWGSSKQTDPYDIACVPSQINGILSMTDPDAGVVKVNRTWGTNCGIQAYALFDAFCRATCAQCKNGFLIADASTGGSHIFEGFYADIPPPGQLICGVTVNGQSFTDFGNNTSYIENPNLPNPITTGGCNYNTPDLFDATATVTSVLGPGPWSTPQQQGNKRR
jgi:hypothetical protein